VGLQIFFWEFNRYLRQELILAVCQTRTTLHTAEGGHHGLRTTMVGSSYLPTTVEIPVARLPRPFLR